jgi:hypothetical protein
MEVAKQFPECFIVADNDPVGIKCAIKTGQPYWVSPVEGEDFNDFELRVSPEEAIESLKCFRRGLYEYAVAYQGDCIGGRYIPNNLISQQ